MTSPIPERLLASALTLALRGLVRAYQLGPAYFFQGSCRYDPGCSRYAAEAVAIHGPVKGTWLAARRICCCHPWGGLGYDPVPPPAGASVLPPADPTVASPGHLPAALPPTSRPTAF